MRLSRNEFSISLCKCLIVLSSRLITRKGRARKTLLPALEEFLSTEARRVRERQNLSRNAREWRWFGEWHHWSARRRRGPSQGLPKYAI
jgi:hypothetical protein